MPDKLGEFEFGRVYNMDMREGLKRIPDGSVHCIWTDPPYGIKYQDGDLASCIEQALGHAAPVDQPERSIANDGYDEFTDVVVVMLDQAARVLAKDAAVCCCCCGGGGPTPVFADVAKWMDARLAFDQAVVWDKGGKLTGGMMSSGGMGWRYRRNYEFVMVAHRKGGRMSWYDQSAAISNVIRIPRIIPRAKDHPTPKPVELIMAFLKLHTVKGDIVIDPFSGGGSTGEACVRLGRRFVGFELDQHWTEFANERMARTIVELGQKTAKDSKEGDQLGFGSLAAVTTEDEKKEEDQVGLLPVRYGKLQVSLDLPEEQTPTTEAVTTETTGVAQVPMVAVSATPTPAMEAPSSDVVT
jgi:site-specific DNA-methyltransferase (adenine-specific)